MRTESMTEDEFNKRYECYDLDDEYGDFLIENQEGSRLICNGYQLTLAIEDEYRFAEFKEYMLMKRIL
jgi:hypothetical protein